MTADVSVSYWVTGFDHENNIVWEGLVLAREHDAKLAVDNDPYNQHFMAAHQQGKLVTLKWEKAWEEIEIPRLPENNEAVYVDPD